MSYYLGLVYSNPAYFTHLFWIVFIGLFDDVWGFSSVDESSSEVNVVIVALVETNLDCRHLRLPKWRMAPAFHTAIVILIPGIQAGAGLIRNLSYALCQAKLLIAERLKSIPFATFPPLFFAPAVRSESQLTVNKFQAQVVGVRGETIAFGDRRLIS